MPRADYRTCRQCERHASECGPLSHERLCTDCALENVAVNLTGICDHGGPAFLRWRRAMAASVGGALVDDTLEAV